MAVYQRTGRKGWTVDIWVAGRRIQHTVKNKAVADLLEKDLLVKCERQEFLGIIEVKKITFKAFAELYLDRYARPNKSPKGYEGDVNSLKALRSFFTGLLTEIKAEKIEEYKAARLAQEKTHATVNRELACLSKLLRKAVEWHYLKVNPMAGVKLLKEPPGRLRYLEPEEIDTLYGALEDLAP
jgi:site-specific recombinase XerD